MIQTGPEPQRRLIWTQIDAVFRQIDAVKAYLGMGAGTWKRRLRAFKGRAEVGRK